MLDHVADLNKEKLFKLSAEVPFPDFVQESDLMDKEAHDLASPTEFADPNTKTYPISTAADTFISAAFYHKYAAEGSVLPEIVTKLKEACQLWDINWESTKPMVQEKVASSVAKIEYVCDNKNFATVPVENMGHLDKLASDLIDNPGKYPYNMRNKVAAQILAVASVHNHELPEGLDQVLEKTAGQAIGSYSALQRAISMRESALRNVHGYENLDEAFGTLKEASMQYAEKDLVDPTFAVQACAVLDGIDRSAGLTHKYASGEFEAPELMLFETTLSKFDGYQDNMVKLANGAHFMQNQVDHAAMANFLKTALGKEANELTASDVVKTLDGMESDHLMHYLETSPEQGLGNKPLKKMKEGEEEGEPTGDDPKKLEENEDTTPRK